VNDEAATTVPAMVAAVHRRAVAPSDIVQRSLATIARLEPKVRAWAYVAPEASLIDAAAHTELDAPLSGIPIGIKDVIDVAAMPTGYGANLPNPRLAEFDSACVGMLRRAGAVPIGKTVTAEFAYKHPGPTRNPHDLARTPGGSSSGSAAAVAAGMVLVSIGTQTGGSMIRPAAFCGVIGFKPSFGTVPRDGMKICCESLDVIGWYGRSVADVTAIAEVLLPESAAVRARERLPRVALLKDLPGLALDADAGRVLQQAADTLTQQGATCSMASVSTEMIRLAEVHRTIMQYEFARSLAPVIREQPAVLSEVLLACVRDGFATPDSKYLEMKSLQHSLRHSWSKLLGDADFLIAPSAVGEAPLGLSETGSSAFNVAWSAIGWPCMHIPAGLSRHGLPLGIQVIADWQRDVDLLAWGRWIESRLASTQRARAFSA
jgi:Asp-tRNA(Asn)/Glu-tRNA(Gln) amidotransferase A subunit family amidase